MFDVSFCVFGSLYYMRGYFFYFSFKGGVSMTYANMASAPTQTSGSSPILASDWNTFVRDNFADIRAGHVVCTSGTRPSSGLIAGTMVFETDTGKIMVYTGSVWVEVVNLGTVSAAPAAPVGSPIGEVTAFAGGSAPTGWLLCDGSAVSRTTYANLFAVCSTTYGVGDGSATFNVPNLAGRSVVGAGTGYGNGISNSGATSYVTTSASGSVGVATIGVAAGHGIVAGNTIVVAGVTPSGYNGTYTVTSVTSTSVSYTNATTGSQTVAGTISPSVLTSRTRGSWFGDERLALHTHTMGNHTHSISGSGTTSAAGNHAHNVSDSYAVFSNNGNQLASGSFYGRFSFSNADQNRVTDYPGDHQHSFSFSGTSGVPSSNTTDSGGTGAQENIMPSLVLNYIIKY
jgi:microcystin-dependent protein